jgi:hypothetical protein
MQTAQTRITETRAESRETGAQLLILLAAAVSFVLSVTLWFGGHQLQGIFVGLWVPSILSLGTIVLRRDRP